MNILVSGRIRRGEKEKKQKRGVRSMFLSIIQKSLPSSPTLLLFFLVCAPSPSISSFRFVAPSFHTTHTKQVTRAQTHARTHTRTHTHTHTHTTSSFLLLLSFKHRHNNKIHKTDSQTQTQHTNTYLLLHGLTFSLSSFLPLAYAPSASAHKHTRKGKRRKREEKTRHRLRSLHLILPSLPFLPPFPPRKKTGKGGGEGWREGGSA